jgi:tRNA-specific 2-thiouridylase
MLVAMSGGVDSSVAAAVAVERHGVEDVVGATLKLWGGESDSGCCSVADVEDARRVADQLGIVHHVFNFSEAFGSLVVDPFVDGHASGRTPNPCIACNRHVKFDLLLERARRLGFDIVATGHHARVTTEPDGTRALRRGADAAKDQSYVVSMLTPPQLARVAFPVGNLTKADVRAEAARLGLRTATKPDSQDVCFIRSDEGRGAFLAARTALHPGRVVDGESGATVGTVPAVELVTVGQRRGVGHALDGRRRYVVDVDVDGRTVVVGPAEAALATTATVGELTWTGGPPSVPALAVLAQCSAHGQAVPARLEGVAGADAVVVVRFARPVRRVAPGQTVAFYDPDQPDRVVGSGVVGSGVVGSGVAR